MHAVEFFVGLRDRPVGSTIACRYVNEGLHHRSVLHLFNFCGARDVGSCSRLPVTAACYVVSLALAKL